MKHNRAVLCVWPGILRFFGGPFAKLAVFLVIGFCLLLQAGCEEQAVTTKRSRIGPAEETRIVPPKESETTTSVPPGSRTRPRPSVTSTVDANAPKPKIMFEKVIHDFGKIGPGTRPTCEFPFKNAGEGLLKITRVQSTCGCAVAKLTKREYKPGESGTIHITYIASQRAGPTRNYVYVHSNDKANPKVALVVKGTIIKKVTYEPKRLNLLLERENADCPEITITSVDGKKFSITSVRSTANCITADIDSSIESAKFVLQPKVDVERLQKSLNGTFVINLSHPELKYVTLVYSALSRFTINPPRLVSINSEPGKPIKRDVWVLNNYGETFEIESVSSQNGLIKVTSQQKVSKGYQLKVEITPPPIENNKKVFKDVLSVSIKGGEKLAIECNGFYSPKVTKNP